MTIETLAHTDSIERLPHSDLNWEEYEACKADLVYYEDLLDCVQKNDPENKEKIFDIEDIISACYSVLSDIVSGKKVNYQSII
jgi:hypothetical protein